MLTATRAGDRRYASASQACRPRSDGRLLSRRRKMVDQVAGRSGARGGVHGTEIYGFAFSRLGPASADRERPALGGCAGVRKVCTAYDVAGPLDFFMIVLLQ